MKFTLKRDRNVADYWNGMKPLPAEINVVSHSQHMAECELLSVLSVLHGHLTPFDILTGSDPDTEKDRDITAVLAVPLIIAIVPLISITLVMPSVIWSTP
jgi:hypothetical protein